MVERSAIRGSVGGSSDLRISSLRWGLAIVSGCQLSAVGCRPFANGWQRGGGVGSTDDRERRGGTRTRKLTRGSALGNAALGCNHSARLRIAHCARRVAALKRAN